MAAGLAAGLTGLSSPARAQTPTSPPTHHGIFSRLFHPHGQTTSPRMAPGMHPGMAPGRPGGMAAMGRIIGNKRTHVYHLPGTPGALPSAANTIYFTSEAAAMRAGYHRAGASHGSTTHKMRGSVVPMSSRTTQ